MFALPRRLFTACRNKFYVLRCNLRYKIARPHDGRSAVALFGHTKLHSPLIGDYLGHEEPATLTTSLHWPSASLAARLARSHGLTVFNGCYIPRAIRPRLLHLPPHVGMTREIHGSIGQVRASLPMRLRATLKKIESKGFRIVISHDTAALAEFHERYHRPSMLARHGKDAYIVPLSQLQAVMQTKSGELLQVFDGDRWIAALCGSFSRETGYRIEKFGWLDGDPRILETGAVKLLYWQALVRTTELGLPRLHFGGSAAFLEDGVFYQKNLWGGLLESPPPAAPKWGLLISPSHPHLKTFLTRRTLVLPDGGTGYYALSARSPAEVPAYAGQAGRITAWYRLRDIPMTAAEPQNAKHDLPACLHPWFDSLPLED